MRHRVHERIADALTDIMSRPGWVGLILAAPNEPGRTDLLRLIILLFRHIIEREGLVTAARWARDRERRRGRVRLIRGRRVRSRLRPRRRDGRADTRAATTAATEDTAS